MEISKTEMHVKLTREEVIKAVSQYAKSHCGIPAENIDKTFVRLRENGADVSLVITFTKKRNLSDNEQDILDRLPTIVNEK